MGVAHRGWSVAVDLGAAAITDDHRDSLGLAVKATLAADVEHFALAAEHRRDDSCGAGEAPGIGGTDLAAGVEGADPRGVEICQQLLQGHGDDDGGRASTGLRKALAGDRLEQLAERQAVTNRRRQVVVPLGVGRARG